MRFERAGEVCYAQVRFVVSPGDDGTLMGTVQIKQALAVGLEEFRHVDCELCCYHWPSVK